MVEHRSHSAGLEYDASAGWKLRKLGRDIRRRRRHLRLVDDSAVSSHDANLRFRHRHVQPGKILHCWLSSSMTEPILSASAEEPRPLPDVEKRRTPPHNCPHLCVTQQTSANFSGGRIETAVETRVGGDGF